MDINKEKIIADNNLEKFLKWQSAFAKACKTVGITLEQGIKLLDETNENLNKE